MESECQEQINQSQSVILEIGDTSAIAFDRICRLCSNPSEKVIGIYSEEGVSNDLGIKMNLYLPVKVADNDTLPLQCCWNCASTVLAWHELVVASVEADRRLRELQILSVKQITGDIKEEALVIPQDNKVMTESAAASLNVFLHSSPSANTQSKHLKKKKKQPTETLITLTDLKTEEIVNNATFDDDLTNSFLSDCEDIAGTDKLKIELDKEEFELKTEIKHLELQQKYVRKKLKNEDLKLPEMTVGDDNVENFDEKSDWLDKDKLDVFNFACQYCSLEYVNEDDILHHVKEKHSDKVNLDHPILQALGKKDKRKHTKIDQDAVNAAKVVVEGRIYYNCKICGKSLYSPYTYIWHMRIHTGERPYVCDLCGKQFRVSQGLVRHLRETHQGIKNFPCDLCGRMFATRRNVEEHRRIHTNERPYICDLCGKSFKQKASLFVHNRSHTDYFPYRCSYCNQGFRTRPPLLIHVTRHTGEKPYPCDICGRCFRIKYELKRHRLIHSDEKPFSCTDCGLSFRQKRYLRNHNKTNHKRSTP